MRTIADKSTLSNPSSIFSPPQQWGIYGWNGSALISIVLTIMASKLMALEKATPMCIIPRK